MSGDNESGWTLKKIVANPFVWIGGIAIVWFATGVQSRKEASDKMVQCFVSSTKALVASNTSPESSIMAAHTACMEKCESERWVDTSVTKCQTIFTENSKQIVEAMKAH